MTPRKGHCLCGQPLHYGDLAKQKMVEKIIRQVGEDMIMKAPDGRKWYVPRHYVVLHEVRPEQLPGLAIRYNLQKA